MSPANSPTTHPNPLNDDPTPSTLPPGTPERHGGRSHTAGNCRWPGGRSRTAGSDRWPERSGWCGRVLLRAPVAQGIEHRPPEAGAQVRILPGALLKGAGQRWYDERSDRSLRGRCPHFAHNLVKTLRHRVEDVGKEIGVYVQRHRRRGVSPAWSEPPLTLAPAETASDAAVCRRSCECKPSGQPDSTTARSNHDRCLLDFPSVHSSLPPTSVTDRSVVTRRWARSTSPTRRAASSPQTAIGEQEDYGAASRRVGERAHVQVDRESVESDLRTGRS